MLTQSQIDSTLEGYKRWYWQNYPLCLFCAHCVRKDGQLAHLIRRSESRSLQAVKLNTGLAHDSCHSIFDDSPDQAVYLPRIIECLYIIYLLDEDYFNRIASNYEQLADVLQLFPSVEYRDIEHHGELVQLTYLYS
jgi:lipopolysaccharide biosynthesis protein